jgi:hypothetical protein
VGRTILQTHPQTLLLLRQIHPQVLVLHLRQIHPQVLVLHLRQIHPQVLVLHLRQIRLQELVLLLLVVGCWLTLTLTVVMVSLYRWEHLRDRSLNLTD